MHPMQTDGLTFTLPSWLLWGIGGAVAITLLLILVSWLVSQLVHSFSGGFIGDGRVHFTFGEFIQTFITLALVPSLVTAWLWSTGLVTLSILVGAVLFVALYWVLSALDKRRRSY